jgi:hypothetical protein
LITKYGGNVHAPFMLTAYTEDTNSNNEFAEPPYENNIE